LVVEKTAKDKALSTVIDLTKQRVRQLYQFLREANQLRFRPVRELSEQPKVVNLGDLPQHPSVQLVRPVRVQDGHEVPDLLLRVKRPNLTRCPQPPETVEGWLLPGWDDPSKPAIYAEGQNAVDKDGNTITVRFEDDDERITAFLSWDELRQAWAPPEVLARRALRFFEVFYDIHSMLEKESEQLELLVADGHLAWRTTSSIDGLVTINHPVLLKRVELRFDPNLPEFTIHETDREPEIYGALFVDLKEVAPSALRNRQNELASSGYHPLGWEDTDAFLKAFVQTVSPVNGEFFDESSPAVTETPRMWRNPVLLLRKRVAGIANAIDAIIDDIEHREVFPPALAQITGTADSWDISALSSDGSGSSSDASPRSGTIPAISDDEILLAKETNEEQLQIIRRLSHSGSVIVQGPPGTGKTHTIGNLIGHLLAQGKSILVTAHTTKALRVLRDKVPDVLQPLCVAVQFVLLRILCEAFINLRFILADTNETATRSRNFYDFAEVNRLRLLLEITRRFPHIPQRGQADNLRRHLEKYEPRFLHKRSDTSTYWDWDKLDLVSRVESIGKTMILEQDASKFKRIVALYQETNPYVHCGMLSLLESIDRGGGGDAARPKLRVQHSKFGVPLVAATLLVDIIAVARDGLNLSAYDAEIESLGDNFQRLLKPSANGRRL
jgi:hypothetical protein